MRGMRLVFGIVLVVAAVGVGLFLYVTRDIAAPSADIQASVQAVEPSSEGGVTVFRIAQEGTRAEYNIYEQLNGADKTVVGVTDQVAGEIALNLDDLSLSQVGEVRINARTFATDDNRRDNAVARLILQAETSTNEFIVFRPMSITGLSGSAGVGDALEFQMSGELTIAGVTQPVTFDVGAVLETPQRLTGQAQTAVSRSSFNLSIPDVPFVANVGDEVTLKLDFVAAPS